MTTGVDVLREAATLVRGRAEAATPGPWTIVGGGDCVAPVGIMVAPDDGGIADSDAAHIATWHPGVAVAVADWLDRLAVENGDFVNVDHPAMVLADVVLQAKE